MGRSLSQIINSLPKERRQKILARSQELKNDVISLRELRTVAGKAQAKVAETLHISQPSVSKIENQTDMYLSTLTNYVQAIGGELKLTVFLPSIGTYEIKSIGELANPSGAKENLAPKRILKSKKQSGASRTLRTMG